MKTTVFALLAAGLSWGVLSACGEKHDVLGSRSDGGGPAGGTAGSASGATGGSTAAGSGGKGGGVTGGAGGGAGSGMAGKGSGESGQAGAGGGGGTSGSAQSGGGNGGSVTAGGAGNSGEAGESTGGTAGTASGGTGGASPACPTDCRPNGPCLGEQISWLCGNGFNDQEFVDGGCTDQATALPRYCCPPEFFPDCDPCVDATTLEDCEARSYCHPVFTDPNDCSCAVAGCCARFSHCGKGVLASCTPVVITCTDRPIVPFCDDPAYVVSYTPGCTEGCVKPEDCAMLQ
jgi:hypothetical protein